LRLVTLSASSPLINDYIRLEESTGLLHRWSADPEASGAETAHDRFVLVGCDASVHGRRVGALAESDRSASSRRSTSGAHESGSTVRMRTVTKFGAVTLLVATGFTASSLRSARAGPAVAIRSNVEVSGAKLQQLELARWAVGRFKIAGLQAPVVEI
jgi:hypothetical protein